MTCDPSKLTDCDLRQGNLRRFPVYGLEGDLGAIPSPIDHILLANTPVIEDARNLCYFASLPAMYRARRDPGVRSKAGLTS